MSHFYGGISGSRGPASRQGSAESGIDGYVQSWSTRLSVDMRHISHADRDDAEFRLHGGPSNRSAGTLSLRFTDVTAVVDALGVSDPKIQAIRNRIYNEIEKLNAEAPKAVARAEKRRAKEERRRKREEKARNQMQAEVMRDMQPHEKARIVRLLTPRVNLDEHGNFESDSKWALCAEHMGNLRRGGDGHVYITTQIGSDNFGRFTADVTIGQWLLPEGIEPDELGLADLIRETQLGWRNEALAV